MSDEISHARGWTLEAYVAHNEAMRAEEHMLDVERDRRYAELTVEREKASKIKEAADRAALGLAREIQTYKDEKANELRAQIESERGTYASQTDLKGAIEKMEETLKPIVSYVTTQQGGPRAITTGTVVALISAVAILFGLYAGFHGLNSSSPSSTVLCSATYHPSPCP